MIKLLTLISLISLFTLFAGRVEATNPWNSPMGITARNDNATALRTNDPWDYMENRVKLMAEAGAAWDRLFVSSGYIFNPDGSVRQDHLDRLDKIINLYKRYNLNAYFLLYNDSLGSTGACLRNSPPENKPKWVEYLSLLVDRYGDDVKYWEISFEENGPGCPFGDQPELYVDFLKDSAIVIRQHNPQAKIILGRLLPSNINYLNALLQNNAAPYFDVVSLGGPYQCSLYNETKPRIDAVKNILSSHGVNKPIWLTEALCVSDHNLDGTSDSAGHEDQKTYIKEVYKRALAAGAQKIFQQSFVDRNDFNIVAKRMSGIMSIDNAFALHKKPSYSAYQQAAKDAGFPPPSPTSNPADLNTDGKVDIFDYNILIGDFGKSNGAPGFVKGDINKDGKVDIFDYNQLITHFDT